jgi:dipeptidyl-peptidase-3
MRDRALIARWVFENGKGAAKDGKDVIEMVKREGETFVKINDYEMLRNLFGQLLAEIQRIKSTGDYNAARDLVENYAVKIDPELHKEILDRYQKLNIAPYKGFVNPVYTAVKDSKGNITDVKVSYEEGYTEQMLRYSKDYSPLK